MPLSSFLSYNFHTLSSYPLLHQQPPHSTTTFPYVCIDLLTVHICPVLFPSLYFSYVATICLHWSISTLLPLPYLWSCFCISHVFSSLSFRTCSVGLNFLFHLFVVLSSLNHMSINSNLCFGTHSLFLASSPCHTIIYTVVNRTFHRTGYICHSLDSCFMNVLQMPKFYAICYMQFAAW